VLSGGDEHVALHGRAGVEPDQLGERVLVRDPEDLLNPGQERVVRLEESIAVLEHLELPFQIASCSGPTTSRAERPMTSAVRSRLND
jgi:hypothetical protein